MPLIIRQVTWNRKIFFFDKLIILGQAKLLLSITFSKIIFFSCVFLSVFPFQPGNKKRNRIEKYSFLANLQTNSFGTFAKIITLYNIVKNYVFLMRFFVRFPFRSTKRTPKTASKNIHFYRIYSLK